MSNDELLDLVNEKDEVIGTVWKSEAHKDPTKIHREVACAVFNKKGEVLIQQRSMNKTNDPGGWKITAAGHVGAEEDPKEAAEREVLEELGLTIDAKFFGKEFEKKESGAGTRESRFFYVYWCLVESGEKLILDKAEVMNAKWVEPGKLNDFAKKNSWNVNGLSHKLILEIYDSKINEND